MGTHKDNDALEYQLFVLQLLLQALCDPTLVAVRGTWMPTSRFALDDLVRAGCEERLLCDCVAFALALVKRYRVPEQKGKRPAIRPTKYPTAPAYRAVAAKIDELLMQMSLHFPSTGLAEVDENDRYIQRFGPLYDDLCASVQTIEGLTTIRDTALKAADQFSRLRAPAPKFIIQVAYAWPAMYVQYATKQERFGLVAQLLEGTAIGSKNPEQLSKACKNIRKKSPMIEQWLNRLLPCLPTENQKFGGRIVVDHDARDVPNDRWMEDDQGFVLSSSISET